MLEQHKKELDRIYLDASSPRDFYMYATFYFQELWQTEKDKFKK